MSTVSTSVVPQVSSVTERRTKRPSVGAVVSWIFLAAAVIVTLFPFFWMLRTALSNNYSLSSNPGSLLPVDFTWGAFQRVLGRQSVEEARAQGGSGARIDVLLYVRNSIVYAGISTALQISCTTLAAYAVPPGGPRRR